MIQIGDMVKSNHGFTGIVQKEFENWEDLKRKNEFITIGDEKDQWLEEQEIPFTFEQLYERWFSVRYVDGGAIWSCESRLEKINQN